MDHRPAEQEQSHLGIENRLLGNILNRMLTLWTVAGIAALLLSLSRMMDTGWLMLYDIQIVVVSIIVAVSLARHHISNRFKSLLMIAISILIGVSGLYYLGMLAGGIFFLPLAGVMLGLYYSPRITSLFALASVLYLIVIGLGYSRGDFHSVIPPEELLTNLNHWAVYVLCLGMFFLVTLTTIFGYRQVAEDLMAEVSRQRDEISQMINHDPLTGLPNYRLAMDRLDMACEQAKRNNGSCAVLFVDLDNFKQINDSFGHDSGDLCLQTVANRLQSTLRGIDTVARIGGDEFLIVLNDIQRSGDVERLAEKLLAATAPPITINREQVQLGLSIGIALYPEHGTDGKSLKRRADDAMYRVKLTGKNDFSRFDATRGDVA